MKKSKWKYFIPQKSRRGLFSAIIERGRADMDAVGEYSEGCVLGYTYERLIDDSVAMAGVMSSEGNGAALLYGGGAYEVTVSILAACYASKHLILCAPQITPQRIKDILSLCHIDLAISPFGEICGPSTRHIDITAFSATVNGELSRVNASPMPSGNGFSLSFLTRERFDSYSEDSLLFSASAFASMSSLGKRDRTLTDIDIHTSSGAVCILLSSLISGGYTVFLNDRRRFEDCMRQTSPTKLCCKEDTARIALSVLKREDPGPLTHPIALTKKKLRFVDPIWGRSALALKRRLNSARLMRLGGCLKQVTLFEPGVVSHVGGLRDFGVVTASALSGNGYPFAALRIDFPRRRYWTLPKGMLADICLAETGGKGRITLIGKGLCQLKGEPIIRGCAPGEFRLDEWEGVSFVTDLYGFVLPDGNIFVEKQFFC